MSDRDPLDLDALAALEAAATPGPWSPLIHDPDCGPNDWWMAYTDEYAEHGDWSLISADAEFIAAARNALPALIDRVRELEAEVERLHSWTGLLSLLDENFPDDVFPTLADDPARDTGPRLVSALRRAARAEADRDAYRARIDAVRALPRHGGYVIEGEVAGTCVDAAALDAALDGDS